MKAMRRLTGLLFAALITVSLLAQEATPEVTPSPESTAGSTLSAEMTAEGTASPEGTAEATAESTAEGTAEADQCPVIVQTALTLTQEDCQDIRNNQACYGHLVLEAEPQAGVTEFTFGQPGDMVDIVKVRSLSLGGMDVASGVWGVALIQAQVKTDDPQQPNVQPETPYRDVTFLLFGDTDVESKVPMLPVTIKQNVNLRAAPVNGRVLGNLLTNTLTVASGRLEDNSWLLVAHPDLAIVGWVAGQFIEVDGDVTTLNVVEPGTPESVAQQPQGPMQAFVFQSGRDDSPCAAAPNSGLLVQTPEGVASVTVTIDEVVIQLNATAFIQAEPDGTMTVNVIEGTATVKANGESKTIVAGTKVDVPLDENLQASGTPGEIQPIDPNDVNSLPVDLLPEPVEIPAPLDVQPGVPLPGVWRFSWGVKQLTCPTGEAIDFDSTGFLSDLRASANASTIVWNASTYSRVSPGVYNASRLDEAGNLYQETINVIAPDTITGQAVIDFAAVTCTLTAPFSLKLSVPGS